MVKMGQAMDEPTPLSPITRESINQRNIFYGRQILLNHSEGSMVYTYLCEQCKIEFDVLKPASEHRSQEKCEDCGETARRVFNVAEPIIDKTQPEYYHSMGKWITSKHQRKEEMKRQGLVEVGNEKPETVMKEMQKQNDHIRKKKYDEVIK